TGHRKAGRAFRSVRIESHRSSTRQFKRTKGTVNMSFFTSAIDVLQTLVIALGGGLCVWGGINLLEGYGQDNPASKSQGIKQLMACGGVALIGITRIPLLAGLLSTT